MSAALGSAACAIALPRSTAFAHDVMTGLAQAQKLVPGTWLYDSAGRELFDKLARRDAYYPARAEAALLHRAAVPIARACSSDAVVVGLGSGPGRTTELLLDATGASTYVPLDPQIVGIAGGSVLRAAVPGGTSRTDGSSQCLVHFPGGAIDHFTLHGAIALLANIGQALGRGTLLAVAADATQDPALLIPAYQDGAGDCAAFNKNVLVRINRELGGEFDTRAFEHQARWVECRHRVEMHLVARTAQQVRVQGRRFGFATGESIRTQVWRKHTLLMLRTLVRHAGWAQREFWLDQRSGFALHLLAYLG
jgi:uncharacterized SAM-dependent methyltransferase